MGGPEHLSRPGHPMVPGIERVGIMVVRHIRLVDPAPVCPVEFLLPFRADAGHGEPVSFGQPDIVRVVDLEPFADLAHGRVRAVSYTHLTLPTIYSV